MEKNFARGMAAAALLLLLLEPCCVAAVHSTPAIFSFATQHELPDNSLIAQSRVAEAAIKLIGVAYRTGGADTSGFDCSGFTKYVFKSLGITLPRRAGDQAKWTDLVDIHQQELSPGDLVFFHTTKRTFSHVGIYLGAGKFIHSPSSGHVVRVDHIANPYWAARFAGARRVAELPPRTRLEFATEPMITSDNHEGDVEELVVANVSQKTSRPLLNFSSVRIPIQPIGDGVWIEETFVARALFHLCERPSPLRRDLAISLSCNNAPLGYFLNLSSESAQLTLVRQEARICSKAGTRVAESLLTTGKAENDVSVVAGLRATGALDINGVCCASTGTPTAPSTGESYR